MRASQNSNACEKGRPGLEQPNVLPLRTHNCRQDRIELAAIYSSFSVPAELLRKTQEKKAQRAKERLDDYYRRNYQASPTY